MRRRRGSRGSTTIQLALALPMLVLLFLGTWQFGYSYYLYNELEQAVRAGARYGSTQTYDGTAGSLASITAAVQNMVVYGDPAAGATPLVAHLGTGNVVVTFSPATGRPSTITVNIRNYSTGTFATVVPTNKPSVQFPYLGVYTGS